MTMSTHKLSEETTKAIQDYEALDRQFKDAWSVFEQAHRTELEHLDQLREARNAALDQAQRALRSEAQDPSCTVRSISAGPFQVVKKKTEFYDADMFIARLHERELYDAAITEKAVIERIEIDYKEARNFLKGRSLLDDFEDCEDGAEMTPAVSGPKPVPGFGAETKKQ